MSSETDLEQEECRARGQLALEALEPLLDYWRVRLLECGKGFRYELMVGHNPWPDGPLMLGLMLKFDLGNLHSAGHLIVIDFYLPDQLDWLAAETDLVCQTAESSPPFAYFHHQHCCHAFRVEALDVALRDEHCGACEDEFEDVTHINAAQVDGWDSPLRLCPRCFEYFREQRGFTLVE
jgi:hypothetical protein